MIPFMPRSYRSLHLLAVMLLCCSSGCGNSPHADKSVGSVTITVAYGGEPVKGARINLESSQSGSGGVGELDDQGSTTISGVPVGDYVVTVIPPIPEQVFAQEGQPAPTVEQRNDIPPVYRDVATSSLNLSVTEGSSEVTFDLKETK